MVKDKNTKFVIIGVLIFLIVPVLIRQINISGDNTEKVSAKIEKYLYEKYGEEFVVDRIGLRSSMGEEFYQARIYPKSIIGTNKQWDDYYYASASANKYSFGRLGGVGDSYSYVYRNMDVENYLLPEARKTFGERILLKVDVAHKVTGDGSWWAGYKSSSLEEMRKDMEEEPDRTRIELDLQLYIFDRIENEAEKEMRRKQIFDYIQYLKEESLYDYLEMGVIFIDERVLAPSYDDFSLEIYVTDKVREVVEGEAVYMPPMELRKRMSRVLKQEVDQMSEEELLESMRMIRKDELSDLPGYNAQNATYIYSFGMLKENYSSSITDEDKERDYSKPEHVVLGNNLKYIYKSEGRK